MNLQEEEFKNRFEEMGYTVIRGGWPDFLILKNGVVAGVELKGDNDFIKPNQEETMRILSDAGIRCFICRWEWHEVTNYMDMAGREDDILKDINKKYMRKINGLITRLQTTKGMVERLEERLQIRRWTRRGSREMVAEIHERIDEIIKDIKAPPTMMLEQWFDNGSS